jgi:uncharacterized membrane protein YhaH (DUF805 family)
MDWGWLLFSFSGRINRAKYWGTSLLLLVILAAPLIIAVETDLELTWILFVVAMLAIMYCGLAISAKRLHDRDKSAWWLLLFYLVPGVLQALGDGAGEAGVVFYLIGFIISIWALVELGFLRGTVGPNRFGGDPLGGAMPQSGGAARSLP